MRIFSDSTILDKRFLCKFVARIEKLLVQDGLIVACRARKNDELVIPVRYAHIRPGHN